VPAIILQNQSICVYVAIRKILTLFVVDQTLSTLTLHC